MYFLQVTSDVGQIKIGTGNILPNGQIQLLGAAGNTAQGLGNNVQFQVVDGKLTPVQMVNAGGIGGQIRLGKPQVTILDQIYLYTNPKMSLLQTNLCGLTTH